MPGRGMGTGMNTTSYQIIEQHRSHGLQPMDGDMFHTKAALFASLPFADYDAMVIAIDLAECLADGSTPCRNVTEDVTLECWSQFNRSEREDLAEKDWFALASRFVSDEYQAAVRTVEAA